MSNPPRKVKDNAPIKKTTVQRPVIKPNTNPKPKNK